MGQEVAFRQFVYSCNLENALISVLGQGVISLFIDYPPFI